MHQTHHLPLNVFCLSVASSQLTPGTQTIRVQAPGSVGTSGTTILKASPAPGTQGTPKQIITVHKGGQVSSQPQIVTLVKTTQGMTVAQVSLSFCFQVQLHQFKPLYVQFLLWFIAE